MTPAAVRARQWNVLHDDLHLPLLVLRESALAGNLKAMSEWCSGNGYLLAPHGKTTMCPRIFERQIEAGAWAITVATASQFLVCVRLGIRRVLIANQLTGRANIDSVARALMSDPELECFCLVDSVEGVRHLAGHLRQSAFSRRLPVLLEWGRQGWRTGVRSLEQALAVVEAIQQESAVLRLAGVEGFEGMAHGDDEAAVLAGLDGFLGGVERLAAELADSDEWIFSVGGSGYLDRVHALFQRLPGPWKKVLRSGCYVTHDHGLYGDLQQRARRRAGDQVPEFRPALELWSYVQSIPEPNLAMLTFGKRDAPFDVGLPIPLNLAGATVKSVNDQHAHLVLPDGAALKVGDRICCGISHPCTAFDKWRVVPVVDDEYNVIDLYRTCF
ncbi:MAG: amino acid deaminase [Acidobacteria bacterium]|nr:amino acid deaminase [Acidobacteriota bacterium]